MKPTAKARSTALAVLMSIFQHRHYADDALQTVLDRIALSSQDRALVHELVYGVLRHRLTLDWRLNRIATRPMERLPLVIALILRLAAYQMFYLKRIPVSAAVFEAVSMAQRVRGRDWRGFVNGILRALARQPDPVWPDPTVDPCSALSLRYSCPTWIVERWLARWGVEGADALCRHTVQIPPVTVRTNTLRCSRAALAHRLRQHGYATRETSVSPVGLVLDQYGMLQSLDVWQDGWCYIEDEAAQLVPLLLDVQPGQRVLDMCAAPGGKTTHIAQLMENTGTIVAMDRNPDRLAQLTQNCRRLGITNIRPFCGDLTRGLESEHFSPDRTRMGPVSREFEGGFDRILLDAPCSGLGVLRRHPEGKWFKSPELFEQMSRLQRALLACAADLLRPGGILVYSACSTEPEETRNVIETFLREHPALTVESAAPWVPTAGRALVDREGFFITSFSDLSMDGFFAARLRKGPRS